METSTPTAQDGGSTDNKSSSTEPTRRKLAGRKAKIVANKNIQQQTAGDITLFDDEDTKKTSVPQVSKENTDEQDGDVEFEDPEILKKKTRRSRKKLANRPIHRPPQASRLLNLPLELIYQIVDNLSDVRDVLSLNLSCDYMHNLFGSLNNKFWYKLCQGAEDHVEVYKDYSATFDYRQHILKMIFQDDKSHCQHCFKKKCRHWYRASDLKFYKGLNKRLCYPCFRSNTIFRSQIMFIPQIDVMSFRSEALPRCLAPENEFCQIRVPDYWVETGQNPWHLYFKRQVVWIPSLKRTIGSKYPGQKVQDVLKLGANQRAARDFKLRMYFQRDLNHMIKATLTRTQAARDVYLDLFLSSDHSQQYRQDDRRRVKKVVKDICKDELRENYTKYLDENIQPPVLSQRKTDELVPDITRSLFQRNGPFHMR